MLKIFEIWMEGYRASGDSGSAQKIGVAEGETFTDACDFLCRNMKDYRRDPSPRVWGCRLFDNEHEARKAFG